MRTKINSNTIIMLAFVLGVGFIFLSCHDDKYEDGGDVIGAQNSTTEFIKSKKWYLFEEDVSTWGDYNVSYDRTNIWLYFTSDSHGFFHSMSRGVDSALGNSKYEEVDRFTYYVSGNTVYIYSPKYGRSSLTLNNSKLGGYMPHELTIDDYIYMANIMGDESDYANKYITEVKKNLTVSFDIEEHVIIVKSDLKSVFPNSKIQYLQEFECYQSQSSTTPFYRGSHTYDYTGDATNGERIACGWNCAIPDDAVMASMCISSMQSIEKKVKDGKKIDESEYELYNDSKNTLFNLSMQYYNVVHLYVVIDGVKVCIIGVTDNVFEKSESSIIECVLCGGSGKSLMYKYGEKQNNIKCQLCHGIKYIIETDGKVISTDLVTTYNKTGMEYGHAWVDLGLSVKWATTNIGASSFTDYGDYYAWAETQGKTFYGWKNYKYCKGTKNSLTKYCSNSIYGLVDNRRTLENSDDAASVNWGGKWRMPQKKEWEELFKKCLWVWCIINGVKGFFIMGDNGNCIFLPVGGYRYETSLLREEFGEYWSSTYDFNQTDYQAYTMHFSGGYESYEYEHDREVGCAIRPVLK